MKTIHCLIELQIPGGTANLHFVIALQTGMLIGGSIQQLHFKTVPECRRTVLHSCNMLKLFSCRLLLSSVSALYSIYSGRPMRYTAQDGTRKAPRPRCSISNCSVKNLEACTLTSSTCPRDCSRTFASSKRGTLTSEGKYLNARKWQCSRLAAVDEGT